ncbi:MAG: hypothetical protein WC776_05425 [Patescibacteria group bacterium]
MGSEQPGVDTSSIKRRAGWKKVIGLTAFGVLGSVTAEGNAEAQNMPRTPASEVAADSGARAARTAEGVTPPSEASNAHPRSHRAHRARPMLLGANGAWIPPLDPDEEVIPSSEEPVTPPAPPHDARHRGANGTLILR